MNCGALVATTAAVINPNRNGTSVANCAANAAVIDFYEAIGYSVDGTPVRDARGMFGERLGVDVHLVTAASGSMRNLQVCVRRAHLEIAERVIAALSHDEQHRLHAISSASIESRLQLLTVREREVMKRILNGQYNKVIAADLQIAMRTVEVHRARIFEKMNVRSAVELAQLLAGTQLD